MNVSTYRILLRGTGLNRLIDGVDCAVGVFATVFVTGNDEQEARAVATHKLRARLVSKQAITQRTHLRVEEVQPINAKEVPEADPGLTFYRE
jgi:hypothetical protein